jgi:hypothetical protein
LQQNGLLHLFIEGIESCLLCRIHACTLSLSCRDLHGHLNIRWKREYGDCYWNNAERPFSTWNSSRREEMKISAAIAAPSNRVNTDWQLRCAPLPAGYAGR